MKDALHQRGDCIYFIIEALSTAKELHPMEPDTPLRFILPSRIDILGL